MQTLSVSIPHKLDKYEAAQRIKHLLPQLEIEHKDKVVNPVQDWGSTTCTFSFSANTVVGKLNITGTILVGAKEAEVIAQVPDVAMLYKGEIERIITERATQLLA